MTLPSWRPAWLARPRGLLAALAGPLLFAALTAGELAGGAVRAGAVVGLLGLAAWALRRGSPAVTGRAPELAVLERRPLAKEAGVALVEASGRRLVVGFGAGGVVLLAELGATQGGERP